MNFSVTFLDAVCQAENSIMQNEMQTFQFQFEMAGNEFIELIRPSVLHKSAGKCLARHNSSLRRASPSSPPIFPPKI